jgi:hypothetical protein
MNATTLVIDEVLHCAGLFRLGRDIEAALDMVDIVDTIVPLFAARLAEDQAHLARIMTAILQSQERQDWLGVADALEYELVTLI